MSYRNIAEQYWGALEKICAAYAPFPIKLDGSKRTSFLDGCDKSYQDYTKKFMSASVTGLDRHKEAAIFTVEGVRHHVITVDPKITEGDKIFIGQERILLDAALNYLRADLSSILECGGFAKMKRFDLPGAFSCKTDYIDIVCRILYYVKDYVDKNNGGNDAFFLLIEMELADRLFLLEYIAIAEYYGARRGDVYSYLRQITQGDAKGGNT